MQTGALGGNLDVAQVVFTAFVIFFIFLIRYLQRESNREGFPLRDNQGRLVDSTGLCGVPPTKKLPLPEGGYALSPPPDTRAVVKPPVDAKTPEHEGVGLEALGANPLLSGMGPAAYNSDRIDVPSYTFFGDKNPRIVPLAADQDHFVPAGKPDPRGYPVFGGDGVRGGTLVDLWFDRSEQFIRYYEVETAPALGSRRVLVPAPLANVSHGKERVDVRAILGAQFRDVPGTASPTQVTLREEDRICAYYGGGTLWATPQRAEPVI